MKLIPSDDEGFHRSIADLDAFLVDVRIKDAFDGEPRLGLGCCDELDHGGAIREGSTAPVLRDAAEQAMLYSVPFRCAWRIVPDFNGKARLVSEFLQLHLPQTHPRAVRATAVRGDRQLARLWITHPADPFEPRANGRHRELGRVSRDAHTDPTRVGRDVVDTIGSNFAFGLVLEVVHLDPCWIALRPPVATAVAQGESMIAGV